MTPKKIDTCVSDKAQQIYDMSKQIEKLLDENTLLKKEIRKELQSILKDYHYNSDTENMSKDVVIALENLVGGLK